MSLVKYRVKEVAADFGKTPKEIAEIVGKYFEKPRSNTQVLTDEQLNVVFDYMTQKHQISSLEQVFAVAAPKAEEPKPAAEKAPAEGKPAAENKGAAAKPEKPKEEQRKRERRDKQRKAELHGVCSLFLTFSKFHGDHGTKMFCSSAVMSAT